MKAHTGLIGGVNLLLLLGWTVHCRSQIAPGSDDKLAFSIPMAAGIALLLFLNLGGVVWANQAGKSAVRQSFGLGMLVVLLIGLGLCGWAQP